MSGPSATKRTREAKPETKGASEEPPRKVLAALDSNRLHTQGSATTHKPSTTLPPERRRRRVPVASQENTSRFTQESAVEDRTAPPAPSSSLSPRREESQSPASPPSTSAQPPRGEEVPTPRSAPTPNATRPTPAPGGNVELLREEREPNPQLEPVIAPQPVVEALVAREEEEIAIIDDQLDHQAFAYVPDIMRYLFQTERAGVDYMGNQGHINENYRGVLMNWMIQVAEDEEFHLSQETLFLAKGIVDHVLEVRNDFALDRFQLLATAAMLIATKYQDVQQPPAIQQWTELCDNTYNNNQLIEMERLVIQDIDYYLCFPTEPQFLDRFIRAGAAHLEEREHALLYRVSHFYCESTLVEFRFSLFRPSTVALSSVVLALYAMGRRPWTATLAHYSRETWTNQLFRACVMAMQDCILHPLYPELLAVVQKFEHTLPVGAVTMPILPIFDA